MNWIEGAIQNLLIKGEGEIFSRIETIGSKLKIEGTEAYAYCYGLKLVSLIYYYSNITGVAFKLEKKKRIVLLAVFRFFNKTFP